MRILSLIGGMASLCALTLPSHALIQNAAFLQGDLLENGTPTPTAEASSITWNRESSIDPSVFAHEFSDPAKLRVLVAGDYLVAVTAPFISLNDADNRPTSAIEVFVNGVAAPGSLGQSSYIRNQPNNIRRHKESSDHVHLLLPGLQPDDIVEVKITKIAGLPAPTALELGTLYMEKIETSETVFSGLSDSTKDGMANLYRDALLGETPAILNWTSNRKDAGITHTDDGDEITLGAGDYLVLVNVPLAGAVQRASVAAQVLLDGFPALGATAQQGYIRNTSGHTQSSVHFAGMVRVTGTQRLSVHTLKRSGAAGTVTLPAGKQASLYIQKLPASGVFSASAYGVLGGNWNPVDKMAVAWDTVVVNDTARYSLDMTTGQITVSQAGEYLLVYNDAINGGGQRSNPRITVEVNGVEVPGAQTKTHYVRNADGHIDVSATMVFPLSGLAANDRITVSAQQEAENGFLTVTIDPALLTLIKKNTFTADPDNPFPPRVIGFDGDMNGFTLRLQELGTEVDESSFTATANGEDAPVTVSKAKGIVTVTHTYPSIPDPGQLFDVVVSFQDRGTPPQSREVAFQVSSPTDYTVLPASFIATDVDTGAPGFVAHVTQVSTTQSGVGSLHGNTILNAERQIRGEYTDPLTGLSWLNEAAPFDETSWVIVPENVPGPINFEESGGTVDAGNFNASTGQTDQPIPRIPGFNLALDGIAAEFFTHLELEPGLHTFGVNSDDGFEVTSGVTPWDQRLVLGAWNAGRGAADSLFQVLVREAGIYPFRLLWFEGTGGASVEFFSVKDGQKILINDSSNPDSIKAYRTARTRPYILSASPTVNGLADTIILELQNGDIAIREGTIKLLVDGAQVDADISTADGKTTVTYNNAGYFSPGSHTFTIEYEEDTTPPRPSAATFSFGSPGGLLPVLLDNPVAYWRLGETSGTTVQSEVGANLTSRLVGDPALCAERLVPGAASASILFDKSIGQLIDIPDHPEINDSPSNPGWKDKTIELWFKARNLPTSDEAVPGEGISQRQILYEQGGVTRGITIYLKGTQPGPNPQKAELWFNALNRAQEAWGGTLPVDQLDPNGSPFAANGTPIAVSTEIDANTAYHIVLVMNGDDAQDSYTGTLTGYLNGQQFGQISGVHLLYDHTDDIAIAARNEEAAFADYTISGTWSPAVYAAGEMFYFDGWIDEVALYNTALSGERVQAHYQAGLQEVPFTPNCEGGPTVGIVSVLRIAAEVEIEYTGSLKSSANVQGPYLPVPDATSPFRITPSQTAEFFIAE